MANDLAAPSLSYEDINRRADEFLKEHGRSGTLPVNIEEIAEFDLGLDIFPFPRLQETYDVEGFISGDLTVIYVDEFIYNQRPTRYRFTIAHEVGHYIFHADLLAAIHPNNVSGWKEFILSIDEDAYGWMEYQAYTFAAAVLMPRHLLKQHFAQEIKLLQPKIDYIRTKGLSVEASQDYIVNAIATKLVRTFDVSADALGRRISKEIKERHLSLK
jgi:Zn-dependent peptidase ImmA (M78 family)